VRGGCIDLQTGFPGQGFHAPFTLAEHIQEFDSLGIGNHLAYSSKLLVDLASAWVD
jgi:hypothetical protein